MPNKHFLYGLIGLSALHLAITLPLLSAPGVGNYYDEAVYHYPSVLSIRQHWPRLDFISDVISPISPGYHYFLAGLSLLTGADLMKMRLINDFLSMLIPLVLFSWLARDLSLARSFWLVLPVLFCSNFLKASCRVVTDNAALLLTLLTLAGVFLLPSRGWRGSLPGVTAGLAVLCRQLTLWLEAPLLLQSFLHPASVDDEKGHHSKTIPAMAGPGVFLIRLLPLGCIAFLYSKWDGLVPPIWQTPSGNASTAPAAYILTLFVFFSAPFLLALGRLGRPKQLDSISIALVILLGLALALISPNTWNHEYGRWGGRLWDLSRKVPAMGDRSSLFIVLSPLGALTVYFLFRLLVENTSREKALLWLMSFVAWTASFCTSRNIFQRYFEAQILVFLVVATGLIIAPHPAWRPQRWAMFLLGALLVGTDLVEIYVPVFYGANAGHQLYQEYGH